MKRDKFKSARSIRAEKRLESPAPDYPGELPELRRRIIITDFDFGERTHTLDLMRSDRLDCFTVYVDGKLWKERIGFSQILAGIRKALPRVRAINY